MADTAITGGSQNTIPSSNATSTDTNANNNVQPRTGLKKIPPYWYPYRTMAKGRWFDREILEMVSTEFRDRSVEYYRYALESGVTTVNGKIAKPGTIIRNGDCIENIVHRHEPPVTSTPVRILLHDKEREFIVIDKPGSIPVHATGRYFKNSLVEILKDDFGFKNFLTAVNRLDRLTSGLMIIATSATRARMLTEEFTAGTIRKEYIARVKGEFPEGEVRCDQPLLTVDRQMGLNIVHPEGKNAETIFKRMFYDEVTDTSVVHCRPLTGRSHQIRVHLQFLGYPISNDPVYSDEKIWGGNIGKGGIDLIPSDERSAPKPPPGYETSSAEGRYRESQQKPEMSPDAAGARDGVTPPTFSEASTETRNSKLKPKKNKINPAWRTKEESAALIAALHAQLSLSKSDPATAVENTVANRLLPRETGHDIGMGSPVPLSKEAVDVIKKLRDQKDADEDWSRWRDVVFKTKGKLNPTGITGLNHHLRLRGRGANESDSGAPNPSYLSTSEGVSSVSNQPRSGDEGYRDLSQRMSDAITSLTGSKSTLEHQNTVSPIRTSHSNDPISDSAVIPSSPDEMTYCPECYLPLHPDPKPEKLYIFLHALRYTTSFGSFKTTMPEWAERGWLWVK